MISTLTQERKYSDYYFFFFYKIIMKKTISFPKTNELRHIVREVHFGGINCRPAGYRSLSLTLELA